MWRRVSVVVGLVLCGLLAAPLAVEAECDWPVPNSRAVNYQGNSWCEGWYNYDCVYCWNTQTGGSCATNLLYPCTPRERTQ